MPTIGTRKGTGPRTALGKERSKHNALKHGIFSKIVVLEGEPRSNSMLYIVNSFSIFSPLARLRRASWKCWPSPGGASGDCTSQKGAKFAQRKSFGNATKGEGNWMGQSDTHWTSRLQH
jgi:hypothetical protein